MANIKMQTLRWSLFLTLAALMSSFVFAQGQSTTVLPAGGALMLGGVDTHSSPTNAAAIITVDGTVHGLAGMNFARTGHTATVLPDGTVFIFGGIGSDGQIVTTAELFDPATQQFSILTDVLAVPRAFHTATLMTDGTVLVAGGIMAGGQFPDDVQLWDFRSRKALSQHGLLSVPREGHAATLLSDGSVLFSGGKDHFGRPTQVLEIYDPVTKRFRSAGPDEQAASSHDALQISASIPQDGVVNVQILPLISVRFSQLLDVRTASAANFILTGPDQKPVPARVSAAEAGRLVFVVPDSVLTPGTHYVLSIKDVAGANAERLSDSSIAFDTEGEAPELEGPDFIPNGSSNSGPSTTKWQQLPALQASPGTTALAGQVLKLDGWPLENTTLEMDGRRVRTDSTGRFLLQGITPGHHVLWIDGTTASRNTSTYGLYEVGATILPNKTNVLNYTIWMTRLDTSHAVRLPSPTRSEMVITNPLLPGLELHLPPHSVITDRQGKVVHEISITPVPVDKPPFPLPAGVQVPIYFTIQPGGAYIKIADSAAGARLIYPNDFKFAPGTLFEFWNYDADAKGWYIYGRGAVSVDARSIVPDPDVFIYEFTGAMVGVPASASTIGGYAGGFEKRSDPVDIATGQFVYTKTDLALPDILPIALTRTYIANDSRSRSFGIGATDSYDILMVGDINPWTYQELVLADGSRIRFDRISPGTGFSDAIYLHSSSGGPFYGALITRNNLTNNGWTLTLKDGTKYALPEAMGQTDPFCQAIIGITDRYGNHITLDRSSATTGPVPTHCQLLKITSSNGRSITLTHDTQGRITQATDNIGRNVLYTYDAAGRLSTVTDAANGVTTYTYDDQNRMLTIQDARNIVYLTNQYDSAGRVTQQTEGDNGTYLFSWTPTANPTQTRFYTTDPNPGAIGGSAVLRNGCWNGFAYNRYSASCGQGYMPLVAQVDVTDPRGYIERVVFGPAGYKTSDTHALGQPEQQTETLSYYSDNLLQSVTDQLGRVTSFDYDAQGNMSRVTRLDGTPDAVTTTVAYEPVFNQLQSVTDPLGHSTSFAYNSTGELASITDALSHQIITTFNGLGQMLTLADPLGNTTQFGYFGGDLVQVTDPASNGSTMDYDLAGRVTSATDAQGNTTRYQYNNLNLVTQVTDPKSNNTVFSYDPNGNLLSLTDALHLTTPTTWTYDNMDRILTRTDPLLRLESFSYDLGGNLVSSTDRKNQVTSLTYDPLNRLKLIGYNTVVNAGVTSYESTVGYTYDAGNRMTQAVDSAGGTITEGYDNLDRLTSETTPQGQISYGYDLAGRRANMTVAGQPQVTYSYDDANRLTQIAQGTSTVGFSYDTANRRSTLTLSNGVNMSYTYDNDSRVTGITYKFNANTLGNLTYTYDSLGRRTQVGGSFAQTGLPGAVTSATYDAANELTNWNGTPVSYDLNGNMLSDGTNAFSWNARNQVATLNSVSLQYDGFGRRTKNLQNTSFLFDGANAVQELSGSTATANLTSGGIDEMFTRADASGAYTPLQDALGSTIALVDASGGLVTQYAYDPFGNTTVTGATNANNFQYTGRENEGNGLYFYRARYYSPVLGRFVNEDPLGFKGSGSNFYAYGFDNPINLVDPFGLSTVTAPAPTNAPPSLVITVESLEGPSALALFVYEVKLSSELFQTVSTINAENAAYGAEWQSVIAYNQAMLAHPPAPALAGRYTQEEIDYQEYKDRCKEPAPAGLGKCGKAIWRLQRNIDCRDMRWRWEDKYKKNIPGHFDQINNLNRGIPNLQDWIDRNCK
jgi:RHS repeat-associated protein